MFGIVIAIQLNAQTTFKFTTAKNSEITAALKNTTYVLLSKPKSEEKMKVSYQKIANEDVVEDQADSNMEIDPESDYNNVLKNSIQKFWKITKFEFIDDAKFEQMRTDPSKNFIFTYEQKEKDGEQKYTTLNLCFAIGGNAAKPDKMKRIAGIQFIYGKQEAEFSSWKIPGLVKFLQSHAQFAAENEGLNGEDGQRKVVTLYNKNKAMVKALKLYLPQTDLTDKVFTAEAIADIYKGEVEITSDPAEIKELIMKGEEIAWLHKVGPEGGLVTKQGEKFGNTIKIILNGKTGEIMYIWEDSISKKKPEGFLKDDFKELK
jgi:hypothetical protein